MEIIFDIMIGIFFVHDINPGIGGVESHQKAFVEYFFCKSFFNFIIEKNKGGANVYEYNNEMRKFELVVTLPNQKLLYEWLKEKIGNLPLVFFLNDPWWIEDVPLMRDYFATSLIMMRSGGNDVEKAPCNLGTYPYAERRSKYK